ncbi:MAG: DUF192 domain-containing protein [Acidimicrobiales bacterium]|nr:DUF192 domain-containing protein [Acidimicrobiales bacterium]
MGWLVVDGTAVAPLEMAETRAERRRGLLGREGIEGAMLLRPARSVHTIGMRFAIDVAHLDADMVVISLVTMVPWRVGRWRRHAHQVIEADAGAMQRWGIAPGVRVEVTA